MLTNDQVTYTVCRMYPHLVSGEDFIAVSNWDESGKRQISDARIERWKPNFAPPSLSQIRRVWMVVKGDYEALVARNRAFLRIRDELIWSSGQIEAAIDFDDHLHMRKIRSYRLALRTVPDQVGFPTNIEWPERPKVRYEDFNASVPDRDGVQRLCSI